MTRRVLAAALTALAAGAAAGALAHSGATGVVKERMDGMEAMSDAAKAIGAVKIGALPFDPDLIRRAAGEISRQARAAHDLFPEGSSTGKSEALPAIWTERARFDALLDDLIAAADRLEAAAADEPAAMAAADEVAEICKDCHEDFRERTP